MEAGGGRREGGRGIVKGGRRKGEGGEREEGGERGRDIIKGKWWRKGGGCSRMV